MFSGRVLGPSPEDDTNIGARGGGGGGRVVLLSAVLEDRIGISSDINNCSSFLCRSFSSSFTVEVMEVSLTRVAVEAEAGREM